MSKVFDELYNAYMKEVEFQKRLLKEENPLAMLWLCGIEWARRRKEKMKK